MIRLLISFCLAATLYGCASSVGRYEAGDNCQNRYAQLSARHSNILSSYQSSASDAQTALTRLEHDVLAAVQNCKNNPQLLVLIADVETTRGENEKALYYARQAEVLAPNMMEANHTLGNVLILVGDYENGLKYIEKASSLVPDSIYIRANLCSNYEMAKKYHRALEVCTEVIESGELKLLGPILYVRARAFRALGQFDKAELDFNRSKALGHDGTIYYSDDHLKGGKIE